jgi:uncharacterized protein YicC (UPF0701 family)
MIGRRKENVAEYSAEMRTFNKRKVDSQITGPRFLRFPDKKIKRAFLEKLVYCRTRNQRSDQMSVWWTDGK